MTSMPRNMREQFLPEVRLEWAGSGDGKLVCPAETARFLKGQPNNWSDLLQTEKLNSDMGHFAPQQLSRQTDNHRAARKACLSAGSVLCALSED